VSANNLALDSRSNLSEAFASLVSEVDSDSYIAIHAYLDRNRDYAFEELRDLLAKITNRPATFGWGPRFLHSTGQYHKGGPAQGVFVQIIGSGDAEVAVPGRDFGFAELMDSQAAGDADVLSAAGRPVLTLRIDDNIKALGLVKTILAAM
jgi:glucose-6-phosphate isomerase